MPIDPELLEILACPACKSDVFLEEDWLQCVNAECRRRYAIKDDIPIMLIDESQVLDEETFAAKMRDREKKA